METSNPNRDDETRTVQSEPIFGKDPIAERHAHDSGTLAPSRAEQPKVMARSVAMWLLAALTLFGLAMMVFIALHPHPVDDGKIRGPGDEAAPNAPSDYKHR